MPLNIKDSEVDRVTRELAGVTGESITVAVGTAVSERLKRVQARPCDDRLIEDLTEIALRAAARPVLDDRTADEIIGYDKHGLPN